MAEGATATQQTIEALTKEKLRLEENLNSATERNATLDAEKKAAELQLSAKETELTELKTKYEAVKESLEEYTKLGKPEVIAEAFENQHKFNVSLASLGKVDDLKDKMEALSTYEEIGEADAITERLEKFDSYAKFGEPEAIEEAMLIAANYVKVGSLEHIQECFGLLDEYMEIGPIQRIQGVFDDAVEVSKQFRKDRLDHRAETLAESHALDKDVARELLEQVNGDDSRVADLITKIRGSNPSVTERYRKGQGDHDHVDEGDETRDIRRRYDDFRPQQRVNRGGKNDHMTEDWTDHDKRQRRGSRTVKPNLESLVERMGN